MAGDFIFYYNNMNLVFIYKYCIMVCLQVEVNLLCIKLIIYHELHKLIYVC